MIFHVNVVKNSKQIRIMKHQKRCNFMVEALSKDISSNNPTKSTDIEIPEEFRENQDYKEMFFKIMQENTEFKKLINNATKTDNGSTKTDR